MPIGVRYVGRDSGIEHMRRADSYRDGYSGRRDSRTEELEGRVVSGATFSPPVLI